MPPRKTTTRTTSGQPEWTCDECGTAYRLKVFTCPRCHGTRFTEVGGMAKISTFGGVSDVRVSGLLPGVAGEVPEEVVVRADGTTDVVNGELTDVEPVPADTDDDSTDDGPADGSSDGTDATGEVQTDPGLPGTTAGRIAADPATGDPAGGGEGDVDRKDDPPFDPGDFTVAKVKDKLEGLSDEDRERVIAAERHGLNRKGVTG